jgi:hypothetical protein
MAQVATMHVWRGHEHRLCCASQPSAHALICSHALASTSQLRHLKPQLAYVPLVLGEHLWQQELAAML